MPSPRLGPRLPQRRPRPVRRRGPLFLGPRRRAGQARRPPDRARRGRRRAAGPARRRGAAAAVRTTAAGNQCSSATSPPSPGRDFDRAAARACSARAAGRARAAARVVDSCRPGLGKVDRAALPVAAARSRSAEADGAELNLSGTRMARPSTGRAVLGSRGPGPDADFFAHGGGSLSAAHSSRCCASATRRSPSPTSTPTRGSAPWPTAATSRGRRTRRQERTVRPTPRGRSSSRRCWACRSVLVGLRWLTCPWPPTTCSRLRRVRAWAPRCPGGGCARPGWCFISPAGRMAVCRRRGPPAARGVRPAATRAAGACSCGCGPPSVRRRVAPSRWPARRGSPTTRRPRRQDRPGVDLHSLPPITGMLTLGAGATSSPRSTSSGYWIDGDVVHIGPVRIGARDRRRAQHAGARRPRRRARGRAGLRRARRGPGRAAGGRVAGERRGKARHRGRTRPPAPGVGWLWSPASPRRPPSSAALPFVGLPSRPARRLRRASGGTRPRCAAAAARLALPSRWRPWRGS